MTEQYMTLLGKVVLVTGAGSGIGLAIAKRFHDEGAQVCIADISIALAQDAASKIGRLESVLPLEMDVCREDDVEESVEAARNRFGKIDILINNAGIQHIAPIVQLTLHDWRRVVDVHLNGSFLATRACMRRMIADKVGGSIIFIGSVHSHLASALKAPYVAAKHGVLGFARTVAKEGAAHGIRSNVICPGFVRTPLVEAQIAPQANNLNISEEEVISKVMLKDTVDGEFTTTADVAETAVFLAAFPSNAMTGQSIVVSHGWHLN
jgi:3-hydroxybutyrate dehydrogenase